MSIRTLYDRSGQAVAYIDEDQESIFLYTGKPVAFLSEDSLYSYSGRHLGWLDNGWVRDHVGRCVFFTEDSNGGPVRPVRAVRPVRGVRGVRPVRGVREVRPVRPVNASSWSNLRGPAFFAQRD